jgi:hypothetical protein
MEKQRDFIPNIYTRLLSKADTKGFDHTQCWPWLAAGKGNGYGSFNAGDQFRTAHSMAYELMVGPIPDGMEVCHSCDNRYCINPDHLFVGTRGDNMQDMKHKGRGGGGNRKHLKEVQVQEIRRRLLAGNSPRKIANQMNVNYGTVTAIKEGRSYVGIGE